MLLIEQSKDLPEKITQIIAFIDRTRLINFRATKHFCISQRFLIFLHMRLPFSLLAALLLFTGGSPSLYSFATSYQQPSQSLSHLLNLSSVMAVKFPLWGLDYLWFISITFWTEMNHWSREKNSIQNIPACNSVNCSFLSRLTSNKLKSQNKTGHFIQSINVIGLTRIAVDVLLGKAKVYDVQDVLLPRTVPTYEEILRLHISVYEMLVVHVLYPPNLQDELHWIL